MTRTGLPARRAHAATLRTTTTCTRKVLICKRRRCQSGQSTSPCALPEVTAFQPIASDSIYAVYLAGILSVSTGNVLWTSGDSASPGAVAGNDVVFMSGASVLAQGY